MNKSSENLLLRLYLPVALPTWNRVLAMNHWQRKKLRDLTDKFVSMCIREGIDSLIAMERVSSTPKMQSLIVAYYEMIRPTSSQKALAKRKKRSKGKNIR